jgi:hypothetical protein
LWPNRRALNRFDKLAQDFRTFKQEYGYYVYSNGKFKYPMDDRLLLIYS